MIWIYYRICLSSVYNNCCSRDTCETRDGASSTNSESRQQRWSSAIHTRHGWGREGGGGRVEGGGWSRGGEGGVCEHSHKCRIQTCTTASTELGTSTKNLYTETKNPHAYLRENLHGKNKRTNKTKIWATQINENRCKMALWFSASFSVVFSVLISVRG